MIVTKTIEQIREHFKERLLFRYGITITDEDYANICDPSYIERNFKGMYKKRSSKTVGYLNVMGEKIIVLYSRYREDNNEGVFATAYPKDCDQTDEDIMSVCFGKSDLLRVAKICYGIFLKELNSFDFNIPVNEAGKLLFLDGSYCFPHPIIETIKFGTYDKWHLCRRIRDIVFGDHPKVEFCLKKINETLPLR